jgi:hypothetical protein
MRRPAADVAMLAPAALLALLVMRPVLSAPSVSVLGPFGGVDAVLQSGILEWTVRHWWEPARWLALPIFYPAPDALVCMDSLLGQALLVWPWRVLGGLSTGGLYNLACAGSLLLAGIAFAALWRAGGGGRAGAALGAAALVGSPYTQSQLGHLNQLPPAPLLFALAALLGAATSPVRGGSSRAWWLWGAALAGQAAWGWYGFAYGLVGSAVIVLWAGVRARRAGGLRLLGRRLIGPALLAAAVAGVLGWPYLAAARRDPEFTRRPEEVRAFSADLEDLGNRGAYRLGWSDLRGRERTEAERLAAAQRQVLHPGWMALLLAVAGAAGWRRLGERQRRQGALLAVVGAVGLVLAFGDSVGLPGGRRLPLPLGLLQEALPPARALRAAWRFSFLATLAVAWWSAAGLEGLLRAPAGGRRRLAVAAGLGALLLLESAPVAVPALELPRWPREAPCCGAPLLSLPAPADEAAEDLTEALWLHRALASGRPVTGGVSGWVPPWTRDLRRALARLEASGGPADSLLAELARLDVREAEIAPSAQPARMAFWRRLLRDRGYVEKEAGSGYLRLVPPVAAGAPDGERAGMGAATGGPGRSGGGS